MFSFSWLHPTARLLIWLMLAVFLQLATIPLILAAGFLPLLASAEVRRHWLKLFLRVRLLLLTLFLVFAYSSPADTPGNWLPAWESCLEAGEHVLRLLVFLGVLAWLLAPIRLDELMGGLWFLLRPCHIVGLPVDRSIARLSLVLACLENPPVDVSGRWSWRQWLEDGDTEGDMRKKTEGMTENAAVPLSSQPLCLPLPFWRKRDYLAILMTGATLLILSGLV